MQLFMWIASVKVANCSFLMCSRLEPLLVRDYAKLAPVQIQAYNAASHHLYSEVPEEIIVPDGAASTSQSTAIRQAGDEGDSPKSPGGTPSRGKGFCIIIFF